MVATAGKQRKKTNQKTSEVPVLILGLSSNEMLVVVGTSLSRTRRFVILISLYLNDTPGQEDRVNK